MKKTLILTLFAIMLMLKANTQCLVKKIKKMNRGNEELVHTIEIVKFPNAKLIHSYIQNKEKKLVHKKWGDYSFGLDFGTPAKSTGGWDRWYIMNIGFLIKGKMKNILSKQKEPMKLNVSETEDAVSLKITEPIPEEPGGKATVSFRQLKSEKDWLFINVTIETGKRYPYLIYFNSYPGSTRYKNIERYLNDGENIFEMKKNKIKLNKEVNFALISNKGSFEKSGNIIVFNSSDYSVEVRQWGAPVVFYFYTHRRKTYNFALSYFNNAVAEDVADKLAEGEALRIKKLMNSMKW